MHSSYILATDTLPDGSGWVRLGTLPDGRHAVHVAPHYGTHKADVFHTGQEWTHEAAQPQFPEGVKADVLYDPSPEPFRWDAFAAAHPELAASPGADKEGNPIPPTLTPHQWAGE